MTLFYLSNLSCVLNLWCHMYYYLRLSWRERRTDLKKTILKNKFKNLAMWNDSGTHEPGKHWAGQRIGAPHLPHWHYLWARTQQLPVNTHTQQLPVSTHTRQLGHGREQWATAGRAADFVWAPTPLQGPFTHTSSCLVFIMTLQGGTQSPHFKGEK